MILNSFGKVLFLQIVAIIFSVRAVGIVVSAYYILIDPFVNVRESCLII